MGACGEGLRFRRASLWRLVLELMVRAMQLLHLSGYGLGAFNFTTEIFVNYANNSRLDPHGFAPFGEVRGLSGQTRPKEALQQHQKSILTFAKMDRKNLKVTELHSCQRVSNLLPLAHVLRLARHRWMKAWTSWTTLAERLATSMGRLFTRMVSFRK